MEKVIMPKKLTIENGAKSLFMNEFFVPLPVWCETCDGSGENDFDGSCTACNGAGQVMRKINVPWTTIKEIYTKAVEHFSQPVNATDAEGCCTCADYQGGPCSYCMEHKHGL